MLGFLIKDSSCGYSNDKVINLKTMGVCAVILQDEGDKNKRKLKNFTSMSSLILENSSSSKSKKESSYSHNSSAELMSWLIKLMFLMLKFDGL